MHFWVFTWWTTCISVMPSKRRKEYSGVITLHRPVPPHLLYHTVRHIVQHHSDSKWEDAVMWPVSIFLLQAPRSVGQKSSSAVEGPYVRSATRKSTRFITHPGSEADRAHTHSPCSLKHLMVIPTQQMSNKWSLLVNRGFFFKSITHSSVTGSLSFRATGGRFHHTAAAGHWEWIHEGECWGLFHARKSTVTVNLTMLTIDGSGYTKSMKLLIRIFVCMYRIWNISSTT